MDKNKIREATIPELRDWLARVGETQPGNKINELRTQAARVAEDIAYVQSYKGPCMTIAELDRRLERQDNPPPRVQYDRLCSLLVQDTVGMRWIAGGEADGKELLLLRRPWERIPIKVLFLDIDEVLNSIEYKRTLRDGQWNSLQRYTQLDPAACDRLNTVLTATGAKVVLSSTWRKFIDLEHMQLLLSQRGCRAQFFGATEAEAIRSYEDFPHKASYEERMNWCRRFQRGREVKRWVQEYKNVVSFAVVDDGNDFEEVKDRLVRPSVEKGLEEHHVKNLIALLNGS